jgi:hypothetical protein
VGQPLRIQCHRCRLEVVMNVDHRAGELTASSFGHGVHRCVTLGADGRPNRKERDPL